MPDARPASLFAAQSRRLLFGAALLAIAALAMLLSSRASSPPRGGAPQTRAAAAEAAQSRARPATVRCVYVQHGGAANGVAAAQIIREEAAAARATGARLHYVMEWTGPSRTWEAWAASDRAVASVSKETFLKMAPESAPAQGREAEARAVFGAWRRARGDVLQRVRASRSIGRANAEFGAEIDRELARAHDVLSEWWVEGSQATDGLEAAEVERRDWEIFVMWARAERHRLFAQVCGGAEIWHALDEADPARFHHRARAEQSVHREALRSRNDVMAATLKSIAATGSVQHPIRVVLFFGLAHAFRPTLREALGDVLTETSLPATCGRYDNLLDIYRDVEAYWRQGDGANADRSMLVTLITGLAESGDPAFVRDRDDLLAALTPADIDGVIGAMKETHTLPPTALVPYLRKVLGGCLLAGHADPDSQALARRWLARG